MTPEEAAEWLRGERSLTNMIPQHPIETWQERIARADAAMVARAYWATRARTEEAGRDLRARNLIAAREFNTAEANRELAQFGEWQIDHAAADREYAHELALLLGMDEGGAT